MYKICHLTSVHDSDDVRIFGKQCVSLAKRPDYDVYLIAPGESREEDGVKVIGIGPIPSNRIKRMTQTTKIVYKKAVELDADVYELHDPELLDCGVKLQKLGKHVIFDSHEYTYDQIKLKSYIPRAIRGAVASMFLKKETACTKQIDGVIFPCTVDGENPFEGRYNYFEYINNTPILADFYDKYDGNRDFNKEPVVCHVGSLTHERGITDLIDACYIAGVKLILAGNYSSPEYQKMLESKHSYKCVDYRGFCNKEQVMDIYRESTIGACTLLKTGQYPRLGNLPTKAYEYMSVELPVLLTDFPYGIEANEQYDFALTVDPANLDEMAIKIKELADNPELSRRLGQNGRKAIKEAFNWNVEEKKLFDFYDKILGESK